MAVIFIHLRCASIPLPLCPVSIASPPRPCSQFVCEMQALRPVGPIGLRSRRARYWLRPVAALLLAPESENRRAWVCVCVCVCLVPCMHQLLFIYNHLFPHPRTPDSCKRKIARQNEETPVLRESVSAWGNSTGALGNLTHQCKNRWGGPPGALFAGELCARQPSMTRPSSGLGQHVYCSS